MDPNTISNSLDLMLVVMLLGFGAYCIFTFVKFKRTYYLTENSILYPGGCRYQDCLQPGEFLDYILPKVLILGIGLILFAAVLGLCQFMDWDSAPVNLGLIVVPVSGLVWYVVMQRVAAKRYW